MTRCPNCNKPAKGRICGYCGASLVEGYFHPATKATDQYPTVNPGSLAAAVVGIFGGLVLLVAAAFQAISVYPPGSAPIYFPDLSWWIQLLATVFCGALFFVQQIVLHGLRFSMLFDGIWLYLSVFGLGFALFASYQIGLETFFGSFLTSVFFLIGCTLCMISCMISIISYRKPE